MRGSNGALWQQVLRWRRYEPDLFDDSDGHLTISAGGDVVSFELFRGLSDVKPTSFEEQEEETTRRLLVMLTNHLEENDVYFDRWEGYEALGAGGSFGDLRREHRARVVGPPVGEHKCIVEEYYYGQLMALLTAYNNVFEGTGAEHKLMREVWGLDAEGRELFRKALRFARSLIDD